LRPASTNRARPFTTSLGWRVARSSVEMPSGEVYTSFLPPAVYPFWLK
jgi:hypothetical protein